MLQLRDEHRGHTVQRRAFFLLDGCQRRTWIKTLGRKHHRRSVSRATQRAQHAAETVVQRHRQANAVSLGKPLPVARVKPVEQDIAMRQHRALRISGGAGRVLNVDRIVRTEPGLHVLQLLLRYILAFREQLVPRQHARRRAAAQRDHPLQLRKRLALQLTRRGRGQLRTRFVDHLEIVRRFIRIDKCQPANIRLPQRVFQLARAIGRVDIDQHHANPRGGKLQKQPFRHVRGPNAKVVARHKAQCQEPATDAVHRRVELGPGHPDQRIAEHKGVAMWKPPSRFAQHLADRQTVDPGVSLRC